MKKCLSIFLILLLSLTMLISCVASAEEINKNEEETLGESLQGDTVDVGDELVPIHSDDCDNIDQALASELKIAYCDYEYANRAEYDAKLPKYDPADVPITFYTKIEECHIFRVSDLVLNAIFYRKIAGYTIMYGGIQTYYVYKDGNFYTVKDAYEQGILSKEGVYQFAVASDGTIKNTEE